jgi:hypothetical protein
MKLNHSRFDQHAQEQPSPGFWTRIGQMFGWGETEEKERTLVKVWDAGRQQYRKVDLDDRDDPLWFAARNLAMMQDMNTKSAA